MLPVSFFFFSIWFVFFVGKLESVGLTDDLIVNVSKTRHQSINHSINRSIDRSINQSIIYFNTFRRGAKHSSKIRTCVFEVLSLLADYNFILRFDQKNSTVKAMLSNDFWGSYFVTLHFVLRLRDSKKDLISSGPYGLYEAKPRQMLSFRWSGKVTHCWITSKRI